MVAFKIHLFAAALLFVPSLFTVAFARDVDFDLLDAREYNDLLVRRDIYRILDELERRTDDADKPFSPLRGMLKRAQTLMTPSSAPPPITDPILIGQDYNRRLKGNVAKVEETPSKADKSKKRSFSLDIFKSSSSREKADEEKTPGS